MESQVVDAFRKEFGETPSFLVRAPGRVNLIGKIKLMHPANHFMRLADIWKTCLRGAYRLQWLWCLAHGR